MEKEWKIIDGFSKYRVSEYGDIYSNTSKKMLKPRYMKDGYVYYRISNDNNKQIDMRAHRFVAMGWLENTHNLETINHKDGNKENNHYSNLEWMNRSDQLTHAYRLGLKKPMRGFNAALSKANIEQIEYIRKEYDNHVGSFYGFYARLSKETGLSQTTVTRIAKRKTYFDI